MIKRVIVVLIMVILAGMMSVPEIKEKDTVLDPTAKPKSMFFAERNEAAKRRYRKECLRWRCEFKHRHRGFDIEFGEGMSIIRMSSRNNNPKDRDLFDRIMHRIESVRWINRILNPVGPRKRVKFRSWFRKQNRIWIRGIWIPYRRQIITTVILVALVGLTVTLLPPLSIGIGIIGATYYYNPGAGSNGDGTSTSTPYNDFDSANTRYGQGHTVLQLAGSDASALVNKTLLPGSNGVWGRYGTGADPILCVSMEIGPGGTTRSNISLSDVEIDKTNSTSNYWFASAAYLNGFTLQGVYIHDNCNYVMAVNAGCTGVLVDDCIFDIVYGGLNFEALSSTYCEDSEISNCTITGTQTGTGDGISLHANSPTKYMGGAGWDVHDIVLDGYAEQALDLTGCGGGQFYNITTHNCTAGSVYIGFHSTDIDIHHCNFDADGASEILINCDGPLKMYKNFIRNNGRLINLANESDDEAPTGLEFSGNTFIALTGSTYVFTIRNTGGTLGTVAFDNNIITTDGNALPNVFYFQSASYGYTNANFSSSNNVIYDPAHDPHFADQSGSIDWATWNETHTEASKDDPVFVDRTMATFGDYRDYRLNAASGPAYGTASYSVEGTYYTSAGEEGTGGMAGIDDFESNSGSGDIGAFEYTVAGNSAPTVTSQAATSVSFSTATGNGNITSTGGVSATTRGVQVNTSESAIGAVNFSESGTYGTGAYTISLTGLADGTSYYYRAYATNTEGTGYGSWVSFTTLEYGTITIASGETVTIADGEDLSSVNFVVESGGTLTWADGADFSVHDIDNEGTVGAAEITVGTVTKGTMSGCGDWLGAASDWEPAECSPFETTQSGPWGDTATWSGGEVPGETDHATLKEGHNVSLTEIVSIGSLTCEAGTITGAGYKITATLENDNGRAFDLALATVSGVLDLTVSSAFASTGKLQPATGSVRNLTLDNFDNTFTLEGNTVFTGSITITDGTLRMDADARTLGFAGITGTGTFGHASWTGKITNTGAWAGTLTYLHGNQEVDQQGEIQATLTFYSISSTTGEVTVNGAGKTVTLTYNLVGNPDLNVTAGTFYPSDYFTTTGEVYVPSPGILGYTDWTPTSDVEVGRLVGSGTIYLPIDTSANLVVSTSINWTGTTNQATELVQFTGDGEVARVACDDWQGLVIAEPTTHTHIISGSFHASATFTVSTDKCISYTKNSVWYVYAGSTNFDWANAVASPSSSATVRLKAGVVTDTDGTLLYGTLYADAGEFHYGYSRIDSRKYYYLDSGTVEIDAGVTLTSRNCKLAGSYITDNTTGEGKWINAVGEAGVWNVFYTAAPENFQDFDQQQDIEQVIDTDINIDNDIWIG